MRQLIEECRANFGSAPRAFSWSTRMYHNTTMPQWCQADPLRGIYRDRNKILQHGRIVWGHIVQANMNLFYLLPGDAPATAIYSLDSRFDEDPQPLKEIAKKIYELKGKTQDNSSLVNISNFITNEMARPSKEVVPSVLAGDTQYLLTTIMVMRKHMPFGFLSARLLPLVVAPGQSEWSFVLPARYWPTALIDR